VINKKRKPLLVEREGLMLRSKDVIMLLKKLLKRLLLTFDNEPMIASQANSS
jgi:hypothetical protein